MKTDGKRDNLKTDTSPAPEGNNLKRFGWIILIIVMASLPVLPACKQKAAKGRAVVRFLMWKPNQPAVWDEVFRLFRQENPDITLLLETGPASSTSFHDLLTQKLKNKSEDVDVFFMDVIWPPEFAAAGWAMPLDELFAPDERKRFLDGAILANTYEGKIYGAPLFVDSGMLYYRKDLLKKYGFNVPETWQEVVNQAKRISKAEGHGLSGYSGQFKQYEGLVCDMMEFILSNCGHLVDPDTGRSAIDRRPATEAVKFVRDRIIGGVAPQGVLTYQEPESLDLFIQGKAVFHRNWPYAWEISNNPKRSVVAGKVGIAKLPHFPGGKSYSALGGWQLGISNFSRNKEAAWKFVQFLTSDRIQKLLAVRAGLAPTRQALYGDREVLKANPQFASMKYVFATAYPRPRSPLYPALSNVMQRYFSTAISDRNSDIQTLASDASREMDRIISLTK